VNGVGRVSVCHIQVAVRFVVTSISLSRFSNSYAVKIYRITVLCVVLYVCVKLGLSHWGRD